ncbi:MAG: hypothetical protein WCF84_06125 [Anaerolineae bacterium]
MSQDHSIQDKFAGVLANIGQTLVPLTQRINPAAPVDDALHTLTPRVLTLFFDPIVDPVNKTPLSQTGYAQNWNKVDTLIQGYIADVAECSGGLVQYQEVTRQTIDHFPLRDSGQRYAGPDYMKILARQAPVNEHDLVNYQALVDELKLADRRTNNEFDEVWMFGFPYAGFYETRMIGKGAFWCNAPELVAPCPRFVITGFNYERGVGEMLEDLGHRGESILWHIYGDKPGPANLWERFSRYDLTNPGQAEVGWMHWAPNTRQEYDWANCMDYVPSKCDDWYNFPHFAGTVKQVSCQEWGGGDIRAHHKWWFKHLPKVAGNTNGIRNNWWSYIINTADPSFG